MLIQLLVRRLGHGSIEAKPANGSQANELRMEAIKNGAPKSYAPVLWWGSINEARVAFDGMMSELEFEALGQGKEVVVAMDLNHFKQYADNLMKISHKEQ